MSKVLFIPLNTNHVLIFYSIMNSLRCSFEVLCHDNISEAKQYHTEDSLKRLKIPYRHLPKKMNRQANDNIYIKVVAFFEMRSQVRDILRLISPDAIILAIDNDPIAQLFIEESKRLGIWTILIQEALIRPYEFNGRRRYFSDYVYKILRYFGILLAYTEYATGRFDKFLISGKRAFSILQERGLPEHKMEIVGQPKYDVFIEKLKTYQKQTSNKRVYLFAASTTVVNDEMNIRFLELLLEAAKKLGIYIIVKLHPRTPESASDIYKVINISDTSFYEIVKEGDETFEILKRSDALITVSSTMVLEALMMDKECITADYLAGTTRLDYSHYDAVYSIQSEAHIYDAMRDSLTSKKSYQKKKHLLEDELFKLDGRAGERAATFIENMTS